MRLRGDKGKKEQGMIRRYIMIIRLYYWTYPTILD